MIIFKTLHYFIILTFNKLIKVDLLDFYISYFRNLFNFRRKFLEFKCNSNKLVLKINMKA